MRKRHLLGGQLLRRTVMYAVLVIGLAVTLVPLLWVISSSLRPSRDMLLSPFALPWPPAWENYVYAWQQAHIARHFINSVLITVPATILVVTACSLAGYAFAWLRFRGSKTLVVVLMLGLTVPAEAYVLPLAFQMRDLGLLNNPLSVVLAFSAVVIPIGTFLMRAFFADVPEELRQAARLDGCNEFDLFWRVMLPLARPGLITLAILSSVWSWNDFLHPFLFLTRADVRTLPIAVVNFQGDYGQVDLAPLLAAAVMSFAPILALYVVLQRRFVQGVTAGALKG
jgi:raffinose/stachyose/melibiose transport system permease protein